jgi:hypothetical protein
LTAAYPGDIIPERRAKSSWNAQRHQIGLAGDIIPDSRATSSGISNQTSIDGTHQGLRSCAAPPGRTHDRNWPSMQTREKILASRGPSTHDPWGIMLAAPRAESVAEPEEILLVDRVQHLDHGALDDLVLHRRDAERALPPVRLRYVPPPRW